MRNVPVAAAVAPLHTHRAHAVKGAAKGEQCNFHSSSNSSSLPCPGSPEKSEHWWIKEKVTS